jgi:exosortase/archaeosortase family protein
MTGIILHSGEATLILLGYDARIFKNIIYIEGSEGVKIINACLGWSMMALFTGFVLAYPSKTKPKYWFIPLGIFTIVVFNILRLTAMAAISYISPDLLDFYHRYIFKIILYLVVFTLWIFWTRKYGE